MGREWGSGCERWARLQPWGAGQDCGVPRAAPGLVASPASSVARATRWQQEPVADCLVLSFQRSHPALEPGGEGSWGLPALLLRAAGELLLGQQGWRNPDDILIPKWAAEHLAHRPDRAPLCGTGCSTAGVYPSPSCIALASPLFGTCEFCWGERMRVGLGTALL